MKFTLEIRLGNAEMQTCFDVSEALKGVTDVIARGDGASLTAGDADRIYDANGNTVGSWQVIA